MVATREDLATQTPYKVIGTRPIRPDGLEKVTGRALYGADINLPGMLYGAVLRSPHAHARIKAIRTDKAAALPGVHAIITHADLPPVADKIQNLGETAVNTAELQKNILARDKVLYRGHAVAAVAATSLRIAQEALQLIEVDYEVLPPVLDVRAAMQPDAPLLDENRRTRTLAGLSDQPSNIASHIQFKLGDVEAGFAQADIVIEREFTTKMVHQGYIEPHNGTAMWNPDGTLTIWTSTQGQFSIRNQCAEILQHPINLIRVIPMEIGGGFGGKIPVYLEPLAALLSRKSGRPVKMTMSRTEEFEASGPTSGSYIKLKMGVTKAGKIVAAQATLAYEAGAFPGSSVAAGCMCMLAAYDIPNLQLDGYDVVVNKPKVAAYRAPGSPAATFAAESVVDELAELLGMDPLEFRLQNASKEGTRTARGTPHPRIGNIEVLEAAKNSPHYQSKLEPSPTGKLRGRGVANGYWFNAGLKSSVAVSVNPDGTVNLTEGSPDIGGTRASLAMQLAETLGIPYSDVRPAVVDTDSVGHNDVTGGSRVTFASGLAVYEAAQDVLRQLRQRAAQIWSCDPSEVDYQDGTFSCRSDPSKRLTFKELAGRLHTTGTPVMGRAQVAPSAPGPAFCVQIIDVEVDPETGKTDILRATAVQDVGRAIHPSYVEGQIQGGMAQGIGWALNEEYYYTPEGALANASFLDYRMPTALDLPLIETILVEVPNPSHPYGVRGVGEVPIVAPLAAVANALYRATGKRFRDLPINPGRILQALHGIE
jgi:CO/xanthine dehydrogenase Mo-binding subunit